MKRLVLCLSVVIPLHASAAAPFEGVIEMKVTGARVKGTMTVHVSPLGARNETKMENIPVNHVVIHRKSSPDTAIMMDTNQKTWTEMDLKRAREMTRPGPEETFTVKKLGSEKIQGLNCDHVRVTGSQGSTHEMWVTRELGDDGFLPGMGGAPKGPGGGPDGLARALKEAKADGFPMKAVHGEGESLMTMEVVKLERKAVPASMFDVPAGFTRQQGPMGPQGIDPALVEKMKTASPEERQKMVEEMKRKMLEEHRAPAK